MEESMSDLVSATENTAVIRKVDSINTSTPSPSIISEKSDEKGSLEKTSKLHSNDKKNAHPPGLIMEVPDVSVKKFVFRSNSKAIGGGDVYDTLSVIVPEVNQLLKSNS
jgi:hypothetical protein